MGMGMVMVMKGRGGKSDKYGSGLIIVVLSALM
jgi:hypothetical protein